MPVECGEGWKDLYQPLLDLCECKGIQVLQVKEKFGGLRFYIEWGPEAEGLGYDLYRIITAAERASYHTCEMCGEDGYTGFSMPLGDPIYKVTRGPSSKSGWIKSLCDPCRIKRDEGFGR